MGCKPKANRGVIGVAIIFLVGGKAKTGSIIIVWRVGAKIMAIGLPRPSTVFLTIEAAAKLDRIAGEKVHCRLIGVARTIKTVTTPRPLHLTLG